MTISEVNITPVKPTDGLVAFASCVVDGWLYIGSIGLHKLLSGTGYRLTYPTKKLGMSSINYFHPVTKKAGQEIEEAVIEKAKQILERSDEDYGRYNKATNTNH